MKFCFVDTSIINQLGSDSELQGAVFKFLEEENCHLTISFYNLIELKYSKPAQIIYLKHLLNRKSIFVLKPFDSLLNDEFKSYPKANYKSPIFFPLTIEILEHFIKSEKFVQTSAEFMNSRSILLENMQNEMPQIGETASAYVERRILANLKVMHGEWLNAKSEIDFSKFRALSSEYYLRYYKFFKLKDRKPRTSDPADVLMSSGLDYLDFIITEKNMAHDINEIRRKEKFFIDLTAFPKQTIINNYK
jgi:hypothetical protein